MPAPWTPSSTCPLTLRVTTVAGTSDRTDDALLSARLELRSEPPDPESLTGFHGRFIHKILVADDYREQVDVAVHRFHESPAIEADRCAIANPAGVADVVVDVLGDHPLDRPAAG